LLPSKLHPNSGQGPLGFADCTMSNKKSKKEIKEIKITFKISEILDIALRPVSYLRRHASDTYTVRKFQLS
jgi:DNA-binding CsgD family transcriptional regulator